MVLVHLASLADSPLGALYAGATDEKGHEVIEKELASLITSHGDLMPHGEPYPAKMLWTNRGRPLQYVVNEQSGTFAKKLRWRLNGDGTRLQVREEGRVAFAAAFDLDGREGRWDGTLPFPWEALGPVKRAVVGPVAFEIHPHESDANGYLAYIRPFTPTSQLRMLIRDEDFRKVEFQVASKMPAVLNTKRRRGEEPVARTDPHKLLTHVLSSEPGATSGTMELPRALDRERYLSNHWYTFAFTKSDGLTGGTPGTVGGGSGGRHRSATGEAAAQGGADGPANLEEDLDRSHVALHAVAVLSLRLAPVAATFAPPPPPAWGSSGAESASEGGSQPQ